MHNNLAPVWHAGDVLARLLVEAIEAHVTSGESGDNYDAISRRAGFPRGYVTKLRTAVKANPDHRIDTSTLERLAAAIGYEVKLLRKAPTSRDPEPERN